MVLLSHLWERVRLPDRTVVVLSAEERVGGLGPVHSRSLIEFQLDDGLPVWLYDLGDFRLEKRVLMPHGQNTVYVRYLVARGDGISPPDSPAFDALPSSPCTSDDVIKCQVKPIDFGDYQLAFNAAQQAKTKAIFAGGVCDWSKPGVEQRPPAGTWRSFDSADTTD